MKRLSVEKMVREILKSGDKNLIALLNENLRVLAAYSKALDQLSAKRVSGAGDDRLGPLVA